MPSSLSSTSPEEFAAFVETQVNPLRARPNAASEKPPAAVISSDPLAEPSSPAAPSDASLQPDNAGPAPSGESQRKSRRKGSRPGRHKPKKSARRIYYPGIAQFTFERHRRLCRICQHPDRHAIESDFVEWRDPDEIHKRYKVDYSALYRHARATGLLPQRQQNVSIVVHKILEYVDRIEAPSIPEILRAVRTLACLNERGQWTRPPTTHIVSALNRLGPGSHAGAELPGAAEALRALPSIDSADASFEQESQYSNRNSS